MFYFIHNVFVPSIEFKPKFLWILVGIVNGIPYFPYSYIISSVICQYIRKGIKFYIEYIDFTIANLTF